MFTVQLSLLAVWFKGLKPKFKDGFNQDNSKTIEH